MAAPEPNSNPPPTTATPNAADAVIADDNVRGVSMMEALLQRKGTPVYYTPPANVANNAAAANGAAYSDTTSPTNTGSEQQSLVLDVTGLDTNKPNSGPNTSPASVTPKKTLDANAPAWNAPPPTTKAPWTTMTTANTVTMKKPKQVKQKKPPRTLPTITWFQVIHPAEDGIGWYSVPGVWRALLPTDSISQGSLPQPHHVQPHHVQPNQIQPHQIQPHHIQPSHCAAPMNAHPRNQLGCGDPITITHTPHVSMPAHITVELPCE